jgi:hypothetical protein
LVQKVSRLTKTQPKSTNRVLAEWMRVAGKRKRWKNT